MTDFSRLLTPYEKALLAQAEGWFAEILTAIPYVAPDPEADPRLIVICMTPRSGSTALSGLLWATRALGRGGERLSRTNAFVQRIVAETPPRSRRHLLEMAVNSSRTKNGVGLIKCDLPQILPFLVDADSMALLSQAHFVYLTRGDVLGQAISRYRGIKTGLWHASTGDKGKHVQAEGAPPPEAPYDRAAIQAQIDRITQMMASYERLFALLGIRPLRISYEEVTADPGGVLARIAALVGVDPGPAEQSDSLDAGGFARVGGKNNDDLRSRFLADSRRMLGLAPPPGKGQAPDPAPVPLPRA